MQLLQLPQARSLAFTYSIYGNCLKNCLFWFFLFDWRISPNSKKLMLDAMEEPAPVPGSSSKEIKVKSDALYLANSKTWSETWRRVWGRKIFFVEKFFECPFLGNNFHFFSYRPYFVCLLPVSTVLNRIFYNKKPLFHNKIHSFITPIFVRSYLPHIQ